MWVMRHSLCSHPFPLKLATPRPRLPASLWIHQTLGIPYGFKVHLPLILHCLTNKSISAFSGERATELTELGVATDIEARVASSCPGRPVECESLERAR